MAQSQSREPMDVAREYVEYSRKKRKLDQELGSIKSKLEELEQELLTLIEDEKLPESFKLDGARIYTREQLWASPSEGDHAALTAILSDLGLVEYLPSKVNSHSMSAYVREHVSEETGEVEGLDPRLQAALKISRQTKAVCTG